MMQEAIVALIVFCAAIAVLKRYAPKKLKQATRVLTTQLATKLGWKTLATKIEAKAEDGAACGSGCGSCGSCGTEPAKQTESKSVISAEALKKTIPR